jgi:hypothetical protein
MRVEELADLTVQRVLMRLVLGGTVRRGKTGDEQSDGANVKDW